jgi:hypothetical protein
MGRATYSSNEKLGKGVKQYRIGQKDLENNK